MKLQTLISQLKERSLIHLDVEDETIALVITVTASALLDKEMIETLSVFGDNGDYEETPEEFMSFIGTTHVFEVHTHSYKDDDRYESFMADAVKPLPKRKRLEDEIILRPEMQQEEDKRMRTTSMFED